MWLSLIAALGAAAMGAEGSAMAGCAVTESEKAMVKSTTSRMAAKPDAAGALGGPYPIIAPEGCVIFRIRVTADGRVAAVAPVRTAGSPGVVSRLTRFVGAFRYQRSSGGWQGLVLVRLQLDGPVL